MEKEPCSKEEGSITDDEINSKLPSELHSQPGPSSSPEGLSCDELRDYLLSKGIPEICVAPFQGKWIDRSLYKIGACIFMTN